MAGPEELLTVAGIAAEVKMNEPTIGNRMDSGYLPAIRIGRWVPVKRSGFDALLEANYTASKQPPAGAWGGDVPAPAAPGENADAESARPDDPGDAGGS